MTRYWSDYGEGLLLLICVFINLIACNADIGINTYTICVCGGGGGAGQAV